jgi:hypothetical protein
MTASLFADLLGQPRAVQLLEAALTQRRLAPAYLFAGPDGVGRRLAALRFLEGMLAGVEGSPLERRRLAAGNHPDLLWLEPTYSDKGQLIAASQAEAAGISRRTPPQLRLEQIREVSRFLARRPVEAPGCLVVLEGVEAMAEGAANALLKTLEEPGDGLFPSPGWRRSWCGRCWPPSPQRMAIRCATRGVSRIRRNWRSWPPVRPARCWAIAAAGSSCPRDWRSGCWCSPPSPWRPWSWPASSPKRSTASSSCG